MYIEDEKALEIIIERMEIKNEEEHIADLQKWIEREGLYEVFIKVHNMYKEYLL